MLRKSVLDLMTDATIPVKFDMSNILITIIGSVTVNPSDPPNDGSRRLASSNGEARDLQSSSRLSIGVRIKSTAAQEYTQAINNRLNNPAYNSLMGIVANELTAIINPSRPVSPSAAGAASCPACVPPGPTSPAGLSAGAAAGIAIGVILLLCGAAAAGLLYKRKRGSRPGGIRSSPVKAFPQGGDVPNPAFGVQHHPPPRPGSAPSSPHANPPVVYASTTPIANPYFQANGAMMASPVHIPGQAPDSFDPLLGDPRSTMSLDSRLAAASNPSSPRPPSTEAQTAVVAQRNEQLKAFAASLASREGASAAFKRGADALFNAQESASEASRKALVARIMRKWSGRKASEMTPLEAALVCQRGWMNYRARKLVKMWVKIVAFDGDVFYKNKLTGTLEWEIPPLPPMTRAEQDAAAQKIKPGVGASTRRPAAVLAGPSARSSGSASGAAAYSAAPAPADVRRVGKFGAALAVQTDPESGDQFVYDGTHFYFLDGPGGKLLKAGWRRLEDVDDVWYANAEGETVWEPIYEDAV
jgi:hypothetical protein